MSGMQVMKYPVVKEPPSSLRQEVHTPSEPTEQEKLSHDSLLGDLGSSVPGGLKAALSRHPGSGIPGGSQGIQPEDQRRLRPSLCVYGHKAGRVPWRSYYPTK